MQIDSQYVANPPLHCAVEELLTQHCNVTLDQSKEVADFPILFGLTKHEKYYKPPIYLHLIFELDFFYQFHTGFLQAAQAVKIKFEVDKRIKFKNQFCE